MKIYYRQSGGFAGIVIDSVIDSTLLPPDEANKIQDIINNSKFFSLPSKTEPPQRGADYFEYKITVETEQAKHTVETTDFTMPSELRPLVKFLRSKSKK